VDSDGGINGAEEENEGEIRSRGSDGEEESAEKGIRKIKAEARAGSELSERGASR
jgi:hypothetical protein